MHCDLPFLAERKKLKNVISLLVTYMTKKLCVHIRALKQALNHGLILIKVHRVIQFNQEAWLKPYINVNTKLRTETKNDLQKDSF